MEKLDQISLKCGKDTEQDISKKFSTLTFASNEVSSGCLEVKL